MAIPPARYLYVVAAVVLLLVSFTAFKSESSGRLVEKLLPNASKPTDSPPTDQTPPTPSIVYKPKPTTTPNPITDNFPLAAKAKSPSDLPPIPSYNVPPTQHVPEKTPLLIGFTRNWPLLQQTIVGYITAVSTPYRGRKIQRLTLLGMAACGHPRHRQHGHDEQQRAG
jgi:hypothetical protein